MDPDSATPPRATASRANPPPTAPLRSIPEIETIRRSVAMLAPGDPATRRRSAGSRR